MRVSIVQLYSEAGTNFPFSTEMQGFMEDELSSAATPASRLESKYGVGFGLTI